MKDGSGQAACYINCKDRSKSSCALNSLCKLYDGGPGEDSKCVVDNGNLSVSCGNSSASGNPAQFCYSSQCCIKTGLGGSDADFCKSLTEGGSPTCAEQSGSGAPTSAPTAKPTTTLPGNACTEYQSDRKGGTYGECRPSCGSLKTLTLYSSSCPLINTPEGDYPQACCEVKVLTDPLTPVPATRVTPGATTAPKPTPIAPKDSGWCADGNRQNAKAVPSSNTCNINTSSYNGAFDEYCHATFGSPSDFFYQCASAGTPIVPGYCSNSTKTSSPITVNSATCGIASASYDSTHDQWCHDNYGKNDSQSNYFFKCPPATPSPTAGAPTPTTAAPTPTSGATAGLCQPGSPVETCLCPGTGNCGSAGGPAYTNWGCFTTSFDGAARCCPNDARYACSDGTCKANLAACNASIPSPTPNPATTGCAAPNPSAPTTGYECPSTSYGGCAGGLTCKSEPNSTTGCMCKGSGSTTPTATTVPPTATTTPYTPPTSCVNNPAYSACGPDTMANTSCSYPGGTGYWAWKGEGNGCNVGSGTQTHCYVCTP